MEIDSAEESSHNRAPPVTNTHHTVAQWWPCNQKIHKVPWLLRLEEPHSDVYDPKVVSFGPYHYDRPELQTCQNVKHFTLQMFVEGSNQPPEFFHTKVLEVIPYARNCYVEGSTNIYSDQEFAQMMLLDACFLIFSMGIADTRNEERWISIFNYLGRMVYSLVSRDMFLMENQIPFGIVMLLINLRYDNNHGEEPLRKFLHETIWGVQDVQQQQQQQEQPPIDLFEAFRRVLVWDWTPETQVNREANEDTDARKYHKTFRSAKDLKARGIHFKPSSNKSLKDIKFSSFTLYGQLQLPTWFVSDVTKVFFSNMIAYELCPNNPVDTTVISYVNFMKSLIDRPADVKELREKRILLTSLGSDEDVVKLYRDMNTYWMSYTDSYKEAKKSIQEHYDSKAKTWMAQLINTYFSSPWSVVAWFAGLLLLVLTLVQTYFTVNPND